MTSNKFRAEPEPEPGRPAASSHPGGAGMVWCLVVLLGWGDT